MKKYICILLALAASALQACSNHNDNLQPLRELLERIDKGASRKFILQYLDDGEQDCFELDSRHGKIIVRGSDNSAIAFGIHCYLKYHAGIHLSWDGMTASLPDKLPTLDKPERHKALAANRYAYNYCTFSYSMAFWDSERWQREIDWLALHGINRPLMAVGMEKVWQNLLRKLGYHDSEIDSFIAGPAFQAWWLMDNLEGWGNPSPQGWYDDRARLAQQIITRMRQLGMEPVLPGYSGKMPHDADEKLGLDVVQTGRWCGYTRPSFLRPDDPRFPEIADLYYQELASLYGPARYYSCDPFHEGGSAKGVDLAASGHAILDAMKRHSPDAVWVIQAWQNNPRAAMIEELPQDDLLILDLFSESKPQWGEPSSPWFRPDGFGKHKWIYCMLLNFGANTGLHGKLDYLVRGFRDAARHPYAGKTLAGIGMTAEGIENNPVMFELLTELAWLDQPFSVSEWLDSYIRARYGNHDAQISQAWNLLARSVYGCPQHNTQEGTHESVFCSRPTFDFRHASEFADTQDYYDPADVIEAARLMVAASERFRGCNHFEYDLIDIVRHAVAETGRIQLRRTAKAWKSRDAEAYKSEYQRFLKLIMMQDRLLGTRSEFMLGSHLASARALGRTDTDKARLEWNAKVQITTWGDRNAAERGGLHDYAHKEWSGMLSTLYHDRWKSWFELQEGVLQGGRAAGIDFYDMESKWAERRDEFASEPSGDCCMTAGEIFGEISGIFYDGGSI